MPVTDSPLRYPGGKSQLIPFVIEVLRANDLFYGEYAEPFAGGAGIALTLLLDGYVDRIHINDVDPAIHAFWYAVLNRTDALCNLIDTTKVTIDTWHEQRKVHFAKKGANSLALGFSTLFLNRTNRSGILKGGVIGGFEQGGEYKLDCRFNRSDLIRKIERIARYRHRIALSRLDAVDFMRQVVPAAAQQTLVNIDPPYFGKGPELYTNFYGESDHATLASVVRELDRPWMVTYDDTPEIRRLYADYPTFLYGLNYSAQVKRVGTELMVLAPSLSIPSSIKVSIAEVEKPSAEAANRKKSAGKARDRAGK